MAPSPRNTTAIPPIPLNRPIEGPTLLHILLCALYLGVVISIIYLTYESRQRDRVRARTEEEDEEEVGQGQIKLPLD